MICRFINPSTIQFKKIKNSIAAGHGGKEQITSWATALPQRRHADARCWAPDTAGHGITDVTPWPVALGLRTHYWRLLPPRATALCP
jgi:hypothetical protein